MTSFSKGRAEGTWIGPVVEPAKTRWWSGSASLRQVSSVLLVTAVVSGSAACHRETKGAPPRPKVAADEPAEDPAPEAPVPTAPKAPTAATLPEAASPSAPQASVGVPACTVDPGFSGVFPVAEASAATEVELTPGTRELLVVSDSGQNGAAIAWTPPYGPSRALVLPLDRTAGDDTEGLAWRSGHLYALTSSGFVLEMTPDGSGGLARKLPAYPLGPPPFVCDVASDVNCGKNYEGLCLRGPAALTSAGKTPRCAGYAASRAEGALYCLSLTGDHLQIDQVHPPLKLSVHADSLSDCAFGSADGAAAGALVVTTNLHGGSKPYVVDESTGGITPIAIPGILNDEAVVIDHTGALYQAMDDNGTPSPATRATCRW